MKLNKILEVEDSFNLTGRGLVLIPQLPLPESIDFKSFQETVTIVRPDGGTKNTNAMFAAEHFELVPGGCLWAMAIMLIDTSKDEVPSGSSILVNDEVLAKLPHLRENIEKAAQLRASAGDTENAAR